MLNTVIIEILATRIKDGGINPVTNQPMKLEDIKIEEYRTAVEEKLMTS